jgi:hypothetical protein
MKRFNLYAYHDGLPDYRFDSGMTQRLREEMETVYEVELYLTEASVSKYRSIQIPHGSISILENADTGRFHISEFGDVCTNIMPFVALDDFAGATCGQYNVYRIDKDLPEHLKYKRGLIRPGYYPETIWQFGALNYNGVQQFRSNTDLKDKLYFRGTVYPQRACIAVLQQKYPNEVSINVGRLPFEHFIEELASQRLVLGLGMNIGGDICFRDIEMFGIGVPLLRPQLRVEQHDPLIPNVHYVSVDIELDPYYLTPYNHAAVADAMMSRHREVINDHAFLNSIRDNARDWYMRNCSDPSIIHNLIRLAQLETL